MFGKCKNEKVDMLEGCILISLSSLQCVISFFTILYC